MPPSDPKPKTPLEVFAEVADRVAAAHEGHPDCDQVALAKQVASACRDEPSRIHVIEEMEDEGDGTRTGLLVVEGLKKPLQSQGKPSTAASPAYRQNWETIFGKQVKAGQA